MTTALPAFWGVCLRKSGLMVSFFYCLKAARKVGRLKEVLFSSGGWPQPSHKAGWLELGAVGVMSW